MDVNDLLVDAFGRIRDATHGAVEGASLDVLTYRPDPDANCIAWLVWHLTRIQDDHVAGVAGTEQRWVAGGWAERFGLPFPGLCSRSYRAAASGGQGRDTEAHGGGDLGEHDAHLGFNR